MFHILVRDFGKDPVVGGFGVMVYLASNKDPSLVFFIFSKFDIEVLSAGNTGMVTHRKVE